MSKKPMTDLALHDKPHITTSIPIFHGEIARLILFMDDQEGGILDPAAVGFLHNIQLWDGPATLRQWRYIAACLYHIQKEVADDEG